MGKINFLAWTLLALISHLDAGIKINILMLITTISYSREKKELNVILILASFGSKWTRVKQLCSSGAYDCMVGPNMQEVIEEEWKKTKR